MVLHWKKAKVVAQGNWMLYVVKQFLNQFINLGSQDIHSLSFGTHIDLYFRTHPLVFSTSHTKVMGGNNTILNKLSAYRTCKLQKYRYHDLMKYGAQTSPNPHGARNIEFEEKTRKGREKKGLLKPGTALIADC